MDSEFDLEIPSLGSSKLQTCPGGVKESFELGENLSFGESLATTMEKPDWFRDLTQWIPSVRAGDEVSSSSSTSSTSSSAASSWMAAFSWKPAKSGADQKKEAEKKEKENVEMSPREFCWLTHNCG